MGSKICPLKFNSKTLDAAGYCARGECECDKDDCAWWLDTLGVCGVIAQGYLAGIEAVQQEMKRDSEE